MPSPVVATLATMAVRRSRIFWAKQNQNSSAPFLGLADFPHSIYSSRALSLSLSLSPFPVGVPRSACAVPLLRPIEQRNQRARERERAACEDPAARRRRRETSRRRFLENFSSPTSSERGRREDSSLECPPRIKAWSRCRVLHVICAYVWLASTQRSRFFCP